MISSDFTRTFAEENEKVGKWELLFLLVSVFSFFLSLGNETRKGSIEKAKSHRLETLVPFVPSWNLYLNRLPKVNSYTLNPVLTIKIRKKEGPIDLNDNSREIRLD